MEKTLAGEFTMDLEELFEMDLKTVMAHRRSGCRACLLGPHMVPNLTLEDMKKHLLLQGASAKIAKINSIIFERAMPGAGQPANNRVTV